ncbi:erythromycin esterase, putative [Cordyceps militaris CM01]|uniref:Erythromycin esterase, putative n=1 Tax=Cordyceps militaris (strain CM01) TaxID=983644 RepID=G3JC35_CORMM|nr:erythromycin esterase, putative [Cordyceps militaris CM01]EGX94550.1 erythromycin esterase, putative [Cordyceps militaris CM01]
MSPLRRRSARIAGTSKSTRAVPELLSVTEDAEPVAMSSPRRFIAKSPMHAPSTPPSSAIRPPRSEMHPSKFHQSTGEPSSAVALGFTDIDASDRRTTGAALTSTPSRSTGMPTSSFTFELATSTHGGALSSDAKKIMEELQEKAAKIKVELVAQREAEGIDGVFGDRRFAKPKSLAGRYSAAHNAEFEKMDSIQGHASAWRASRFTPVVAGIKRSSSKASLTESPGKTTDSPSPQKTSIYNHLSQTPKKNLKRKSSAANLDGRSGTDSAKRTALASSPIKATDRTPVERQPMKRVKQHKEDDTSTNRPKVPTTPTAPRTIARPQSTLSRLMSPTKSSKMHRLASPTKVTTSSVPTPTRLPTSARKPTITLVSTPSKPSASPIRVVAPPTPSFAQSLSASNLTCKADGLARRILSPMRMQKVKSILRSQSNTDSASASAIPQPTLYGSHTPAPPRLDKELPPIPFTTPRRKLTKKVTFTPETKRAAVEQSSPTPLKSSMFRFRSASGPRSTRDVEMKNAAAERGGHVAYPDLSAFKALIASKDDDGKKRVPSVPSAFTFRSDHTIEFGNTPRTGFGGSVGQSSVRHVRQSLNQAASLPGSFPALPAPSSHPDKENTAPSSSSKVLPGILHGLSTKKRHRPSTDEEDAEREADERAAKKRKNSTSGPERPALSSARPISSTPQSSAKRARLDRHVSLTPSRQQMNKTPTATSGSTSSPAKKKQGISMSRLQTLARPKTRI